MSVARPVATVGGYTFASRILGLVRDVAFAAILGAGPVAEAFIVAFRLPNLFRRLFAEGAFAVAFVPMFARRLEQEGSDAAQAFAERILAALGATLLVVTLVGQAAMPWLIYLVAWGFSERPETFDLAVVYSRIAFPYLLFISLTAFFSGLLNALRRFAAAAAAPILLNVLLIGALALAALGVWPPGHALAWAVPVAGILQMSLVAWAARRAGMTLRLRRPRLDPDTRRLLVLALPAALAAGVYQINLLVGTLIASFFPGAVAWLQYADRLYQLPLGVVGIALSVVLLPELARRLGASDASGARESFCRAVEIAVAFGAPSAVALAVIPEPIIAVLFERGAFLADDTRATALSLLLFALGLPAFMLGKVYASAFFAREDTRRPLRYATIAFTTNTILAAAGAVVWGYPAIPAATSIAAWLLLALLAIGSREHAETSPDEGLRKRVPRVLAASLIMGVLLFLAENLLQAAIDDPILRYPALAFLVAGGALVYGGTGLIFGAFRYRDILAALRPATARERTAPGASFVDSDSA